VANALDARRQHVLHEAAHKLGAWQPEHALTTLVIGADVERHLAFTN